MFPLETNNFLLYQRDFQTIIINNIINIIMKKMMMIIRITIILIMIIMINLQASSLNILPSPLARA